MSLTKSAAISANECSAKKFNGISAAFRCKTADDEVVTWKNFKKIFFLENSKIDKTTVTQTHF